VLARKVWAFNPFPGAAGNVDGVAVKFWQAEPLTIESTATPGQVLAANARDGVLIACGCGVLRVDQLQKPGGKRLSAAEFLKGFPLEGRLFN
jgi:methionyl-tRNA formyltransferase